MKKISLLIIIMTIALLCGCSKQKSYSYRENEISIEYNSEKELYEVLVIEENKTYYVSINNAEVKITNKNDIIYKGGKLTFTLDIKENYYWKSH